MRKIMDLASSFDAVASSLTEGFVTIDSQGAIVATNPAIEEIFGYTKQELLDQNISVLMPPAEGHAHQAYLNASTVGTKGRVLAPDRALKGRRKDGTIFPITITVFSLNGDGDQKFFLGLITDQSAGEALREERHKTELLYRNIDLLEGVGLWRINIAMNKLEWTDQVFEIHGLHPDTFTPMVDTAIDRYHRDDKARVTDCVQAAIEKGENFEFRARVVRPDGSIRHVRSMGRSALGPNGQISSLFGTFVDITKEREREDEIAHYSAQQKLLKDILYQYSQGGTPEQFYEQSLNLLTGFPWCSFTRANALFLPIPWQDDFQIFETTGFDTGTTSALIAAWAERTSRQPDPQSDQTFLFVPIGHKQETLGYLALKKNGQTATLTQETAFLSAIADTLAICLIDLNKQETITEQNSELKTEIVKVQELSAQFERQAHSLQLLSQELERAKEKAEAASETKSAFLANMSHEVRTPVNGVLGMLSMLELSSLDDDQHECIDLVKQAAYTALELMNDLLDLSQLAAGKLTIIPEKFLLSDLLARLEMMLTPKATKKALNLVIDSDLGECTIDGDALRIQQIIVNLGDNAIKFTEAGNVHVHFSETPGTQALQITVNDTGQGMTTEQLGRIFDRFEQVDPSETRRQEGVGLGLSICQNLTDLMGGEISVGSDVGQGTRFTVKLPVPLTYSTEPKKRESRTSIPQADAGLRVLAAEDNPMNQEILRRVAKALDFELTIADDGAAAIEAYQQAKFDIILMDINMPVMDGITAAKQIRAMGSNIPILAVTADVMDKDKDRFTKAGMNGCVTKPYEIATLVEMIDHAVKADARTEAPGLSQQKRAPAISSQSPEAQL
jgi:PAS domain S-box-containing protein